MNANDIQNMFAADISKKEWVGEIVSIDDPMKMLRVKCKIFGLFDDDELDNDVLPWIFPANNASFSSASGGTGNFDVPKVGTYVKISFPNGDIYSGQYCGIPNINENFRNKIMSKAGDEYAGVHAMRLDDDEGLQIYYTPLQGIIMKLKDCTINVTKDQSVKVMTKDGNKFELNSDGETNDGATLYIKCNKEINVVADGVTHLTSPQVTIKSGKIELGNDGNSEKLVLGTTFKQIFDNHIHIGLLGIPTSTAMSAGFTCPVSDTAYTQK